MELPLVETEEQQGSTGSREVILKLEPKSGHEGNSLELPRNDSNVENDSHQWGWRDLPGGDKTSQGKVIIVKFRNAVRKIGINGTEEAIREAIKSSFGLRSKRAFWLEDNDGVIRSFDREMPMGTYVLHLDEGIKIKIFSLEHHNGQLAQNAEEKTFYSEDGFHNFLRRRHWSGLREVGNFRYIYTFDELHPLCAYQGT